VNLNRQLDTFIRNLYKNQAKKHRIIKIIGLLDFVSYIVINGGHHMKPFCFLTVVFLFMGICSVTAQDLIILKDGNMIEAKVTGISSSKVEYRHFEHLAGPTTVLPVADVLSIRYENGTYEIINPDKITVGVSVNPAGFFFLGTSVCVEFIKGKFNSEINLIYPFGLSTDSNTGIGALFNFNYFWKSRIGGAYLGGGIGAIYSVGWDYWNVILPLGINGGYKFILSTPGIYFRTGCYIGLGFVTGGGSYQPIILDLYFKPDLTIGVSF
jgi:hypothetical protein